MDHIPVSILNRLVNNPRACALTPTARALLYEFIKAWSQNIRQDSQEADLPFTHDRLAWKISRKAFLRGRRELRETGLIVITRARPGTPTLYALVNPTTYE